MPKRKPTDTVQVPVRMQERLRADLEKAAKQRGEKTSLNSEIVERLKNSFLQEDVGALLELVRQDLEKSRRARERAQTYRDTAKRYIAAIERALQAGIPVAKIFPPNWLLRNEYGVNADALKAFLEEEGTE